MTGDMVEPLTYSADSISKVAIIIKLSLYQIGKEWSTQKGIRVRTKLQLLLLTIPYPMTSTWQQ